MESADNVNLFFYVFIIPTFDCHFKTSITMSNSDIPIELKLKAYPYDLAADETQEYYVKVHTQSTPLTQDDLARAVARRLGAEPALAQSFNEVFMEEINWAVGRGYCVSTDSFYVKPVARGTLTHEQLTLPIDHSRVKVYACYSQGPCMAQVMADTHLSLFCQPAPTGPYPTGMFNPLSTGDNPLPLVAGGMAVLIGERLKIVGTHPSVGIRLISVEHPDLAFTISPLQISPNRPKRLQFVLPSNMPQGHWTVEITTQYTHSKSHTIEPRTARLASPVYVEAACVDDGAGDM